MRSRVARNKGENRVTEYPLMSAANGGKTDRCMVCPQKLMGNARYIIEDCAGALEGVKVMGLSGGCGKLMKNECGFDKTSVYLTRRL